MVADARAEARLWWGALACILGLTLVRVVLGLQDQTELSTDEAQYWFWGQDLAFGAYSKPPLIGWLARAATETMGQSVAALRLPAAVLHGMTALVLLWIGRRFARTEIGVFAALTYLTTPAVALGSALMTTDTPMLFFAALALAAQLGLAQAAAAQRKTTGLAVLFGLALGFGMLSKHAMLFWMAGAVAASLASPRFRVPLRQWVIAGAAAFVILLPHLVWLARHQFITAFHVAEITSTHGSSLLRPLMFLLEQAAVMGPLALIAVGLALIDRKAEASENRADRLGLAILVAAPLLIVMGQAVRGQVLANWAVLYLLPGALLAGFWFARHRKVAALSLLFGLAVSLALPILKVAGTGITLPSGKLALARYLGHGEPIRHALDLATRSGAGTLVATGRGVMADLSWFGADSALVLRTVPPAGRPANGWELTDAFDPQTDPLPVMLLWPGGDPPLCPGAAEIDRFMAPPGVYAGAEFVLLRLDDPACLVPQGGSQ